MTQGSSASDRITGLLDRIPGYRGYRDKEDRRDADRRVRDHLVTAYTAQLNRVQQVARGMATQRRLSDVGPVDDFAQTLQHFIDRVRTATYGYGGLFGSRDVNAAALDQLRLFDGSLLAGVDELNGPIAQLEAASANNGDLAAPARAGTGVVRNLLARLDLRNEVIETAQPAPRESVLAVLQPKTAEGPPPAYDLHQGDAVAILGDNYLVDARLAVEAGDNSFRLFRLSAEPAKWLFVARAPGAPMALLSPTDASVTPGAQTAIGGATYTTQLAGSGEGEVVGVGGASGARPVRFALLVGANDPQARAVVLDWGNERQVFAGKEVHPEDVEIFRQSSQ